MKIRSNRFGLSVCAVCLSATLANPAQGGISVVGGLPAGALVSNLETGANDGSTAMAPPAGGVTWYVKGQSFSLGATSTVASVTVRIDDGSVGTDPVGNLMLDLYDVSGGIPSGAPLATQTDPLPAVAVGDYLEITLDTPVALDAGDYAFALSSTDLHLNFDVQNTGADYPAGSLVRNNGSSWEIRSANDFLFAVSGVSGTITLDRPTTWPLSFLENAPAAGIDQYGLNATLRMGQTFELIADARIDAVVVQLDDQSVSPDLIGAVTLELLGTDSRGRPIGGPLAELTGDLPAGLTTNSFLSFVFPATISLPQGTYAAILSTADADLSFNTTSGDAFAGGILVSNPGTAWTIPLPLGQDLVFGLQGSLNQRPPPGAGPNIVVVLADDFGWTDLSTGQTNLGHPSDMYHTPHLERLAREGLAFTACYVQPNCAPTRAALLSGKYAPRTGNGVYNVSGLNRGSGTPILLAPGQNEDVPAATHTLAEMLVDAGYVTVHVGKYHVGGHEGGSSTLPLEQGFDYNFGGTSVGNPGTYFASSSGIFHGNVGPELDAYGLPYTTNYIHDTLVPIQNGNTPSALTGSNKHLADAEGDALIDFLDNHRTGAMAAYPFYIQYHSYAVHTPVQPRPDLSAKYAGQEGTVHTSTDYAGLVEGLDQSVGRILNYLDDPNGDGNPDDSIAEETLVIFLSDNGGHEGPTDNAPLRSRKGSFYDGGIRVPMIARMPGTVPTNQVTHTMVHAVDLYPTLMELAGGSTFQTLDGLSFASHITDPTGQPRNRGAIFYHFPGYLDNRARPCSAILKEMDGKCYKLIYNYDPNYDPNSGDDGIRVIPSEWELYNLTDDLSEANNLLDLDYWEWITHAAVAQALAAELHGWITQSAPDWAPAFPSVRSSGELLGPAPAEIPAVEPPAGQAFRLLEATPGVDTNRVELTWVSDADFFFGVDASADLRNWIPLASGIPGQDGFTGAMVTNFGGHEFYRITVSP